MSNPCACVLVLDRDAVVADAIGAFVRELGHEAILPSGVEDAIDRLLVTPHGDEREIDLVISDADSARDPGGLMKTMREKRPDVPFILITGYGSIPAAVDAIRAGACDFLTKPIVDEELRLAIERGLRERSLRDENRRLRRRAGATIEGVIGADPRMRRIFDLVESVAPSRTTVLMTGESGTGKSLIARAIHDRSPRAAGPFVEIACGSIPETLLESELFGHVRGAFTGAHADKRGRFEAAHGGTIFLDEINSASAGMQLKLLRVLQEKRFEPVGSTETREVDARVVLASNEPLERLVHDGLFRQDLYFRINVVAIELPPLRDRAGDIDRLADAFLEEIAGEQGRAVTGFTSEALASLRRYPYPGNVRELRNIVERAIVLSRTPTVGVEALPPHVIENQPPRIRSTTDTGEAFEVVSGPLADAMRAHERRIIIGALEACAWNRTEAAERLDINRATLYKKMRSLGIDEDDHRRAG